MRCAGYIWYPRDDYRPIQPGEDGTLQGHRLAARDPDRPARADAEAGTAASRRAVPARPRVVQSPARCACPWELVSADLLVSGGNGTATTPSETTTSESGTSSTGNETTTGETTTSTPTSSTTTPMTTTTATTTTTTTTTATTTITP